MKMFKHKRFFVLMLTFVIGFSLIACSNNGNSEKTSSSNVQNTQKAGKPSDSTTKTEDKKIYSIKIGLGQKNTHSYYKAFEKFKQAVETSSSGSIKVEIFPNSQLGSENDMQDGVSKGVLDMCLTGVLVKYEPLLAVLELPYLFKDREQVKKFLSSPTVGQFTKSLETKNIKLLTFYENGFRQVTNNIKPINSPADLKGLKMRTPENPAQIETFKLLGSQVNPLASTELYGALQKGVIDGQENPLQNIHSNKLFEVQKHLAITNHIYNSGYVIMNNDFFNKLPDDLKQQVLKAIKESADYQMGLVAEGDKALLEELKTKGMQVTTPDQEKFKKATEPVYEIFYEKYGEAAKKLLQDIKNSK